MVRSEWYLVSLKVLLVVDPVTNHFLAACMLAGGTVTPIPVLRRTAPKARLMARATSMLRWGRNSDVKRYAGFRGDLADTRALIFVTGQRGVPFTNARFRFGFDVSAEGKRAKMAATRIFDKVSERRWTQRKLEVFLFDLHVMIFARSWQETRNSPKRLE
mmetsp:Transcript_7173/g.31693  ORF Transcript_7173/g.31693 Transcript_7173/m.31693 type:complete len:160 (+) Transcript_7173:2383-2862(+)